VIPRPVLNARAREPDYFDATCRITSGWWPDLVTRYEGPCLVRPTDNTHRVVESGGEPISLSTYICWFPADVDVERGHVVTVLTAAFDQRLEGRAMHVLDVRFDAWQTTRRVVLQDQQ
jgi:hypothetical protein